MLPPLLVSLLSLSTVTLACKSTAPVNVISLPSLL